MKSFLDDLNAIKDYVEGCLEDIIEYRNASNDSVHRDEILVVVNDHCSVMQDLLRQAMANGSLLF